MQDKIKLIQDISKLDYCAINEEGQGDAEIAAVADNAKESIQNSEVYERRTGFAQQKQAKKARQ